MYVKFCDRHQGEEHEAPTVGIVLCSVNSDAMVRLTLPEGGAHIHAGHYPLYLPTEAELRAERERESAEAERFLRHATEEKRDGQG